CVRRSSVRGSSARGSCARRSSVRGSGRIRIGRGRRVRRVGRMTARGALGARQLTEREPGRGALARRGREQGERGDGASCRAGGPEPQGTAAAGPPDEDPGGSGRCGGGG